MTSTKMITVEEEFRKNPELKESDLEALREWCKKQPHLPKVPDIDLILFLHSNYYSIEQTKRTIDNFYTMRTHVPEFFTNRDILNCKSLQKAVDVSIYMPLKGLSKTGYKVIYSRLLDCEPSHFVHSDSVKGYGMVLDTWFQTEGTVPGHVILIDMQGTVMGHLHIHSTTETLEKFIPLDILPNEAGGKAGPISQFSEERLKLFKEFRDWFAEDEANCRVNETLRPGKPKNAGEIFGIEGSFKKLDVD